MNPPITHLFFDLGNVLVGLRSGEKIKALAAKAGQDTETFCEKIWSHERSHDYERGRHTCDEYFALLAEDLDLSHAQKELQEAFCDIFDPLPHRVALVRQLAAHYPLALISNTCAAHIRHLESTYDFFPLFCPRIYSHEVGARKPHPDIYEKALVAAQAQAKTSLFIDDLAENLETPARLGWRTIHLPPGSDLASALKSVGIGGY
ncbi:MAG: HAD family phosphatase [Verrucomicrobia bacterium]|nr:HAD family phosphatase [Verrucomicrobiota bacterium]